MVACITVHNIYIVYLIKKVLVCISTKHIRNPWVKSTTKKCHNASFFKIFLFCPLLFVFKLCIIWVFIVCSIKIRHFCLHTCIHDCQILIRQSNIHNQIWFYIVNKSYKFRDIISIYLCCLYLYM